MIKSKYAAALLFIFVFFQFSFVISQDEPMHDFPQESPSNENFHERPEYDENFFLVDPSSKQVKEQDTFQGKFLNMLFILGLLIGFMILASWLLKKMMKSRITQINQAMCH